MSQEVLTRLIKDAADPVNDLFKRAEKGSSDAVAVARPEIVAPVSAVRDGTQDEVSHLVSPVRNGFREEVSNVSNGVKRFFTQAVSNGAIPVKNFFSETIASGTHSVLNSFSEAISNTAHSVRAFFSKWVTYGKDFITKIIRVVNLVKTFVSRSFSNVANAIKSVVSETASSGAYALHIVRVWIRSARRAVKHRTRRADPFRMLKITEPVIEEQISNGVNPVRNLNPEQPTEDVGRSTSADKTSSTLQEEISNGVKQVLEAAETVKTLEEEKKDLSDPFMKPLDLSQEGAPRVGIVFLAVAVIAAFLATFFFAREFSLRKKTAANLAIAEQARAELEQSLTGLQAEVAKQRDEIARLSSDLRVAGEKAALIDTLRQGHEAALASLKDRYESELAALRNVLTLRDDLIQTFQSNLQAIRQLLEGGGAATVPLAAAGRTGAGPDAGTAEGTRAPGFRSTAGAVLMANREYGFIVVSLGPADGAQAGRLVQIYRKNQPLGQAKIDRVYQNLSAATILSEDTLARVEKGDQVFLALA